MPHGVVVLMSVGKSTPIIKSVLFPPNIARNWGLSRISMLINTPLTGGIQSNPLPPRSQHYSETDGSITFEPIPADYSILTLHTLPPTGGDTLWASGYEVYDRLSPSWQRFIDGLTATYSQPG